MIILVIMLMCIGLFCTITAEKLMHDQWNAKDSYYQKKMIDRAKIYKNISTLTFFGGAILCIYLLFHL
jgi:hypothetical protein